MNGNVDGGKPRSVLYTQILHKALEQPARRRRLLFGLALFVAWRRYTDRVVSSAEEWGPRWLARLVAKAFSMLMDFNGARLVRVHPAPPLEHEFDRGGYEVEIRSTYFVPGTADVRSARGAGRTRAIQ